MLRVCTYSCAVIDCVTWDFVFKFILLAEVKWDMLGHAEGCRSSHAQTSVTDMTCHSFHMSAGGVLQFPKGKQPRFGVRRCTLA